VPGAALEAARKTSQNRTPRFSGRSVPVNLSGDAR